MGRRKKMTEAELENTQTTLTIEDSNQAEAEEAELLASTDSEVVAEESESQEEVSAEEAPVEEEVRKPRARRRRAKKEEVVEEVPETIEVEAAVAEVPIEEEVKKPRKSRAKKVEVELAEIETETKTDSIPSLDQWAAIKELSESVKQILENNKKLQIPAASLEYDTSEFFRPQEPKTLFITKFATAASIVAVILSLVSISLSQSARHAVLSAVDASKQVGIASATGTIPEASPFRKSPRRVK